MKTTRHSPFRRVLLLGLIYSLTVSIIMLAAMKTHAAQEQPFETVRLIMLFCFAPIFAKFLLQSCGALLHLFTDRQTSTSQHSSPLVSVLIPAWNEEVGIVHTIKSAVNADYPNLEVIVINDGSTDQTAQRVSDFLTKQKDKHNGRDIRYIKVKNGGKARALNRALLFARGELIVTVDADSAMAPDAVSNMVRRFKDPKVGAVAGNVIVGNKHHSIEWIQQLEYLYGFFFKRADSLFNSVYIIGGAAAAYRKSVLTAVGGFDPHVITEDIELSTRILAHGYKTRYAPDAVIHTEGPSDYKGLCNQRLRWKYGRIVTFLKHRELFFKRSRKQNPYLTWILLPMAVYSELMLLFEGIFISFLAVYTVYSSDYLPIAIMIGIMTAIISFQIALDPKARFHRNLYLLAPVAWVVLFIIDAIEFQALIRSIKRFVRRENLEWQKWVRVGLQQENYQKFKA